MNQMEEEGAYILGSYFSSDSIRELETNPEFKNTVAKNVLDLRRELETLRKIVSENKLLNKILVKLLIYVKQLKKILGILLIILAFTGIIMINLTNVDMTGTRLLLTYWKAYLIIAIMMVSGLVASFEK